MNGQPDKTTQRDQTDGRRGLAYGRIQGGESAVLAGYRVEARLGDRCLAETTTDDSGRFVLRWTLPARRRSAADVVVFAPWGPMVGHARLRSENLLSPQELVFPAVPDVLANLPSEMGPIGRAGEPLVNAETFEHCYEVVLKAIDEGYLEPTAAGVGHEHGLFSETTWMHLTVYDLEGLEELLRGTLQGDPASIGDLRGVLGGAPRWSIDQGLSLPEPGPRDVLGCLLKPIDPYSLVGAGLLLDRLPQEGVGGDWLERAMGFYLSKSAPLRGVLRAAEQVIAEEISLREFAEFFLIAKPSAPHHDEHNQPGEHEGHELAPMDRGLVGPSEGVSAGMDAAFELPFGPQRWDPCTLKWGRCTGLIGTAGVEVINPKDVPVLVGRVEPDAVCRGYGGTLALYPRPGGSFPSQQPAYGPGEGLMLWLPDQVVPLAVIGGGWSETKIEVDFPHLSASAFGCGYVYWQAPVESIDQRLGAQSDDCYNLLGILPSELESWKPSRRDEARIAIVGAHINSFRVNGQSSAVADACASVKLSWDVTAGVCRAAPPTVPLGKARVRVSNGTHVLATDAPLRGDLTVSERNTTTYTLTVESFAGSTSCGTETAAVTVSRVSRIFLSVPDRVFPSNQTIPVTVRISCPAPAGGQPVDLTSSDLAALPNASVVVPAGATETTAPIGPPTWPGGLVKLTATAQGYVGDSVEVMIHRSNCIPASWGRDPDRYGGRWDDGPTIPGVIGIHLAVLHTGKVLLFSYDEGPNISDLVATSLAIVDSNKAKCALWNPESGSVANIPLNRNLFCSGHCFLGDGQLFVAGGQFSAPLIAAGANRDLHLFNPLSETWWRIQPDMTTGRWYPTCVTLPDGNAMVISGNNKWFAAAGGIQNSLQIFNATTNQMGPTIPLGFLIYHLYPFAYVMPSGEVFVHWKRTTALYDYLTGVWTRTGWPLFGSALGTTRHPFSRTGPGPGTSVLLPLVPKPDPQNGDVTYPAGRVLILGGGGAESEPDPPVPGEAYKDANGVDLLNIGTPATETAEILDLDDPYPQQWRWTGLDQSKPSFMTHRRVIPDSVLLPDGKVLVINGANRGRSGGFLIHFGATWGATNHANEPEIFDPETETWQTMCLGGRNRLYHATAALLPDGRVVVAGHDGFLNAPPFNTSQYTLDIFSPPYLFRGPRPRILYSPDGTVSFESVFSIYVDDPQKIASVALIRQSSVTHHTNTDQRYVRLAVVATSPSKTMSLKAPPRTVAPPGYYMLFVVSHEGVPSTADWIRLG